MPIQTHRIRRYLLTYATALGCVLPGFAQAPVPPAFDVASVKRNAAVSPAGMGVLIRLQELEATFVPVQALVVQAFDIPAGRIAGLPDWTRTEFYDVRAKTSKLPTRPEILSMLQTLLAERFSLKTHREAREMDVYALVVARRDAALGPKLQRVVVNCQTNRLDIGSAPGLFPQNARPPCGNTVSNAKPVPSGPSLVQNTYAAVTMERLASTLTVVGRPVIDKTGLSGTFDVELKYLSEGLAASGGATELPEGVPLRDALIQQLGLELRPDRSSIEFLVIESIARPTPD